MKHLWIARDIDHWLRIGTSKPVKDKGNDILVGYKKI